MYKSLAEMCIKHSQLVSFRIVFYFIFRTVILMVRVYIFVCVYTVGLPVRERAFIDHSPWANVLIEIEEEMLERWIDHDRRSSLSLSLRFRTLFLIYSCLSR